MSTWRFVETDDDGELWMKNPSELHAEIDFQSRIDNQWRRIMVVTKTWVDRELGVVGSPGSGHIVFDAMLVVPDASGRDLKASIGAALSQGGLEHFSSRVAE